jgi:hypothetical protein
MKPSKTSPRRVSQSAVLAMVWAALPAHAALIAYEGFDYPDPAGTQLQGLNGGTGWTEAFPSGSGPRLGSSLTFTGHLASSGQGAVYNTGQTHTANGRNWAAAIADGVYWYSFLIQPESNDTFYGRGTFGILQNGSGTDNQNGFGIRFDVTPESAGNTTLRFTAQSPPQAPGGAIDFANGFNQTYLVLGRLTVDTAANTTNDIWVWQEGATIPTAVENLPAVMSTITQATNSANPALYGRAFGGGLTNADYPIRYDEVRIGTTFNAVMVPEPSAAVLGLIGALGLLRRRR